MNAPSAFENPELVRNCPGCGSRDIFRIKNSTYCYGCEQFWQIKHEGVVVKHAEAS